MFVVIYVSVEKRYISGCLIMCHVTCQPFVLIREDKVVLNTHSITLP